MPTQDDDLAAGHEPHVKHVQLGVDLDTVDGDANPDTFLDPAADADAIEAAWADATTVEQFAADLAIIEHHWTEEEIVALRDARQGPG